MNRRHLVGSLFVAILIAAAGYPALTSRSASVGPPPAPLADLQAPLAEDGACAADLQGADVLVAEAPGAARDFSPASEMEEAACSRCPDGSPQCWSDKQCDSVCGGKGTGACTRINSCYKCCLCAY